LLLLTSEVTGLFALSVGSQVRSLPGSGWGSNLPAHINMLSKPLDSIELTKILRSIDTSLQVLANSKSGYLTTAFITKRALAERLGVPSVKIDKLIFQGILSQGESGLVEGRHYCKLDPEENNPNNYLYDCAKVLTDAWNNFTGYKNDETK